MLDQRWFQLFLNQLTLRQYDGKVITWNPFSMIIFKGRRPLDYIRTRKDVWQDHSLEASYIRTRKFSTAYRRDSNPMSMCQSGNERVESRDFPLSKLNRLSRRADAAKRKVVGFLGTQFTKFVSAIIVFWAEPPRHYVKNELVTTIPIRFVAPDSPSLSPSEITSLDICSYSLSFSSCIKCYSSSAYTPSECQATTVKFLW